MLVIAEAMEVNTSATNNGIFCEDCSINTRIVDDKNNKSHLPEDLWA